MTWVWRVLGPRRDDPVRTIRDPVELDGIP